MAMQYINYIKNRTPFATKSEAPVLSEDDEAFLNKITSEENPPALPPRPDSENASTLPFKDAQFALMDGAQNVSPSMLFLNMRAMKPPCRQDQTEPDSTRVTDCGDCRYRCQTPHRLN
jgi:hypothetical protein